MKKILLICCFLFCLKGFALDAGYAYRFHLNIKLENGQEYIGYVYKYSYNKLDDSNMIELLKEHANGEITMYPHVITVNAGRDNIDFALKGTTQKVQLDEIERMWVTETLSFTVGERIKELSEENYKLIKSHKAKYSIIEDVNVYENVKYILLTWDENQELSKKKNVIAPKIMEHWKRFIAIDIIQSDKYNAFIKTLKESLLKENILLIEFAEAL
ncbi:hypothetical protein [uncultured Kordia sp.]|uniref:hypothetical protein n=1 Tax=uncultured Kordia sp. TaxID=507699 RepID=UPI00261C0553|nr:hypothetical protein [uncultured Kordia sp.]